VRVCGSGLEVVFYGSKRLVKFTGCYYGLYFTGSNFVLTLCVAFPIQITVEFMVTLWGSYLEDKFTIMMKDYLVPF